MSRSVHLLLLFGSLLLAAGCSSLADQEPEGRTTSNFRQREDFEGARRVRGRGAIPAAIDIRPRNGQVFKERPEGLTIDFRGFTATPGAKIQVQVLSDANLAIAEASWVTVAETQAETTPTTFNDATPIFRFQATATPVPDNSGRDVQARFPLGGVLRFRAIAIDAADSTKRTNLPFYDEGDATSDCIESAKNQSWLEVLARCASPFSFDLGSPVVDGATIALPKAATLVSRTDDPGRAGPPPYLNRKGEIQTEDTDEYYDAVRAPRTLDEYKSRYGFRSNGRRDVEATYYNLGDLGIGREMHCTTFGNANDDDDGDGDGDQDRFGTACFVNNYGLDDEGQPDFGGDPGRAIADMVARRDSFATVAMVKFGNRIAPDRGNDVQFFVYNGKGALANAAELDTTGQNASIPNNCTNCHGGRYDRRARRLVGAAFLPFDPEAFLFSKQSRFTYEAQEDDFRELNALVKRAGSPPSIVQLVDGMYKGAVEQNGTRANLDFIPVGWTRTREAQTVYREVVKPYCRTCHVSQVADFAFLRFEDFQRETTELGRSVCVTKEMPIAEATMNLFWRSPARAHVLNTLGLSSACAPERGH